ncbi:ATP-binding cassette domain-containing protein [Salinisphaera sp. LB1]|uniref:branched-chain amino acid ABC transporter ATP-binding protein/permease n=1 Tax=Salinisphaera sp. LB1 TaxID=2183911 RepID=UPI000D708879|nr:ATP-binding cassette domain-containing protein [Salinisphaera sp. LB1]AWN15868.1 Branched-chain amino acid transport ATP-binding protein LivF [Salinisphaera sp. LB1]
MNALRSYATHPLTVMAVALALLPIIMPMLGSTLSLATQVALYALYALGFNLLLGYVGLVSFGSSLFFGFASYVAGLTALHVWANPIFSIVAAVLATAVMSVFVGLLILRRRGIYFALLTLAFTQLFYEIAFHWTNVTGGENGLQGVTRPGFADPLAYYILTAVIVWLAAAAMLRVVHSPFGRVLQVIRDDEQRALSMGYNPQRYKLGAFVLSSALVGLAGALLTFLIRGAYAENMNWQHAGDPVMMTVLGGMHHFLGPLWGAILYINLEDQLSVVTEHWWLIFGALMIAVVLLSPEGLSGLVSRLAGHNRWALTRDRLPPRPTSAAAGRDTAPPLSGTILEVQGLSKRFGKIVTADRIDLSVEAGSIHGVLGPNGAGKTTFFNMLSGLLAPDEGRILFAGRDITRLPTNKRAMQGLVRSFQVVSVPDNLTVFEAVRVAAQAKHGRRASLWARAYGLDEVNALAWQALDEVGLDAKAGDIVMNLPHGEKRLLDIAIALAGQPSMLLLDEPLAGLADAERETVSQLIRRLAAQHTILLIEHDIDRVVALSNRLSVFHQGKLIADGPPDEVVNHPDVVHAYLGEGHADDRERTALPEATERGETLISLDNVASGYHGSRVLSGLSMEVDVGETVALLGRNGVGKTTTLSTLIGILPVDDGQIRFDGLDITKLPAHAVNRLGISIVPQGRRIFPNLTVADNLRVAQRSGGWSLEEAYELFPKLRTLASSAGGNLSGGEQQMLAIARALMAPTRLLLLDEPFEGLAPSIVAEVMRAVERLRGQVAILLIEQRVDLALQIASRAYVMVNGSIALTAPTRELSLGDERLGKLLGV